MPRSTPASVVAKRQKAEAKRHAETLRRIETLTALAPSVPSVVAKYVAIHSSELAFIHIVTLMYHARHNPPRGMVLSPATPATPATEVL